MKKTFQHYITYTDEQIKDIWSNVVFVFDSSALLNIYRYGQAVSQTYMEVLNDLKTKDKLFMPYQVGYEFHENKHKVINEYTQSYNNIITSLEKYKNSKNEIFASFRYHPTLPLSKIKESIDITINEQIDIIKDMAEKHPSKLGIDEITNNIYQIFDNIVGEPYQDDTLKLKYKEGKERYSKLIPPGYKDIKKPEPSCYGDLIIWYQLIDYAKEKNKNIIFVTDDAKEDWWLIHDGKTIMPRVELRKEFLQETSGMYFHMYSPQNFLEHYEKEHGSVSIEKSSLQFVGQISSTLEGSLDETIKLESEYDLFNNSEIKIKLAAITDNIRVILSYNFIHDDFELYGTFYEGLLIQYKVFSDMLNPLNQEPHVDSIIDKLSGSLSSCKDYINGVLHIAQSAETLSRETNTHLHTTLINIDTLKSRL